MPNWKNSGYDFAYRFAAEMLAMRQPKTVSELMAHFGVSRMTIFRNIEQMRRHFPIDFDPVVGGGEPAKVSVRRTAHG